MPIYSGSTKVENLHIGGTKVGEGWIWDGTTWVQVYSSVSPFAPSGMVKSGTHALTGSWARVTGWTADPAYPGSTVVSNALAAQGGGPAKTVSAAIPFTGANQFGGGGVRARLLRNGVVIGTGTAVSGASGTASCTVANVTVVAGDVFAVEAIDTNATWQGTVSAGSSTFVRVT